MQAWRNLFKVEEMEKKGKKKKHLFGSLALLFFSLDFFWAPKIFSNKQVFF